MHQSGVTLTEFAHLVRNLNQRIPILGRFGLGTFVAVISNDHILTWLRDLRLQIMAAALEETRTQGEPGG